MNSKLNHGSICLQKTGQIWILKKYSKIFDNFFLRFEFNSYTS